MLLFRNQERPLVFILAITELIKQIISFTACILYVLSSVEKAGSGKMNQGIFRQGR